MNMKMWKCTLPLGLACVLTAAAPVSALASSPEFARTAEEWAKLRDNVLEYGELEDLITEYNTTVQTNQLDLIQFKKDYGTTKDDVSAKYRDMASEIYSSLSYPDSSDPTYGYVVASLATAEASAKSLENKADNNLEDAEIIYYTYKSAEKNLVTVAQSNMITYEKNQLSLRQAEIAKQQAQLSLVSTQSKVSNGLATQVDLLNAQETVQNADRSIESAKTGIENVRQKLQLMLGWKTTDTPEIQNVPVSDMNRIAQMNPQADKEQAIENNYSLKINQKKLANATTENNKTSLATTIADNKQKIGSALVTNYQNVLAAKLSYDQAEAALQLENRSLQSLQTQYQQGKISKNQLDNQQYAVQNKQLAVQIADLTLFQSMETYDWAVKGLASVS